MAAQPLVGHWKTGEISFERVKLDVFVSNPFDVIFRLESDATYTALVAGHAIPVGMVVQRVRQARITNLELDKGDEVRVTVEAADDDTIETTLFKPRPFDPFDRDRAERLEVGPRQLRTPGRLGGQLSSQRSRHSGNRTPPIPTRVGDRGRRSSRLRRRRPRRCPVVGELQRRHNRRVLRRAVLPCLVGLLGYSRARRAAQDDR